MNVTILSDAHEAESLSDALLEYGAVSVSLQDAEDQPLYEPVLGTTPIWASTEVLALFPEDTPLDSITLLLMQQFGESILERMHVDQLPMRNWSLAWQDFSKPLCFVDRLWILPGSTTDRPDSSDFCASLYLPPGLAFGTGNHPTTALCLEWLASHDLTGLSVLDYGCGSGILGLAALRLGAASITCVDHDPQALQSTLENAKNNAFTPDQVRVYLPSELPNQTFDVIIANILAEPLIELASALCFYLKSYGRLVIAGILEAEAPRVSAAYEACIQWQAMTQRAEWVCLEGRKSSSTESDVRKS